MIYYLAALSQTLLTQAWVPFKEPLEIYDTWMWFIFPLTIIIALVYKTLKVENLNQLLPQTLRLTGAMLLFMVAAASILWGVTEWL